MRYSYPSQIINLIEAVEYGPYFSVSKTSIKAQVPTKHFKTQEPQHPSIDIFKIHNFRIHRIWSGGIVKRFLRMHGFSGNCVKMLSLIWIAVVFLKLKRKPCLVPEWHWYHVCATKDTRYEMGVIFSYKIRMFPCLFIPLP